MFQQCGGIDVTHHDKVYLPGQKQIVEAIFQLETAGHCQPRGLKAEIKVGAGPPITFCPRAKNFYRVNFRVVVEHRNNSRHRITGKTVRRSPKSNTADLKGSHTLFERTHQRVVLTDDGISDSVCDVLVIGMR